MRMGHAEPHKHYALKGPCKRALGLDLEASEAAVVTMLSITVQIA